MVLNSRGSKAKGTCINYVRGGDCGKEGRVFPVDPNNRDCRFGRNVRSCHYFWPRIPLLQDDDVRAEVERGAKRRRNPSLSLVKSREAGEPATSTIADGRYVRPEEWLRNMEQLRRTQGLETPIDEAKSKGWKIIK